MESDFNHNRLLADLYGIYGFKNAENALKAQAITEQLNNRLDDATIKQIQMLIKYAYQNGANDAKQQMQNALNKLSI